MLFIKIAVREQMQIFKFYELTLMQGRTHYQCAIYST